MSKGYYRGSPLGELSGWTLSLWFEAKSDKKGDLFGIVRNENNGEDASDAAAGCLRPTGTAMA